MNPHSSPSRCRSCGGPLEAIFADLGVQPLANSYLAPDELQQGETFYPLCAYVCGNCYLVQLEQFESPEKIFSNYAYFSSYADTWLEHARCYTEQMIQRFGFDSRSLVVEVASNDGYLLRFFRENGVPVLGVEPAANVAEVAEAAGIPTLCKFFSTAVAAELVAAGKQADLLVGNNVLAHVPELNDFVAGLKMVLAPPGVLTMEFHYLPSLIANTEFDTIYHEHFCYFSLLSVDRVFASHGITIFDVEKLSTHGGSLRVYGRHSENDAQPICPRVRLLREEELAAGLDRLETYTGFDEKVRAVKSALLSFMIEAQRRGKSVAAYGAPAKGNTLLNYCGIRTDFIDFTSDRSPHKQGKYLPGTRIPIYAPDRIKEARPDYILILAWNLKDEIMEQLSYVREWGGQFVVAIPQVEVIA